MSVAHDDGRRATRRESPTAPLIRIQEQRQTMAVELGGVLPHPGMLPAFSALATSASNTSPSSTVDFVCLGHHTGLSFPTACAQGRHIAYVKRFVSQQSWESQNVSNSRKQPKG